MPRHVHLARRGTQLQAFDVSHGLDLFLRGEDIEKYIKPLKRNNEQYGWYVYIDRVKADFGGVHIPLEESKISAIEFIQNLKNHLATHSNCGKPP